MNLTTNASSNVSGSAEDLAYDSGSDCERTSALATPIFYIAIAAVGLLANALVIYIIVILKEYQKTVTNVYVVQLAIADFMFLFLLPFEAQTLIKGEWTYGTAFCKINESIRIFNYYASILFLCVMSVDRYVAINHAMDSRFTKFRTRQAVYIISCLVWMVGLLAVVFVLIHAEVNGCECKLVFGVSGSAAKDLDNYQYSDYEVDSETSGAGNTFESATNATVLATEASEEEDFNYDWKQILLNAPGGCSFSGFEIKLWVICNFLFAFLLPLLIICGCYAMIIRKIYEPMSVGVKSTKSNKTRKRVTRMVTCLVTVFFVCWLPYHSFLLSMSAGTSQLSILQCRSVKDFTLVFAYMSSALNPFLYTFLGTNFRKRWQTALGRTRSFRPSIGSRSGADYAHGKKSRRKSSGISMTGHKRHSHDDTNSQSLVTKHTVVPTNNIVRQEDEKL